MELVVLGSGTVAPSAHRTAPAHWVTAGEVRLLLDCGAGMLHRAAGFGVRWSDVTHVAVTHFHPDHWGELPMLLFALRWGTLPSRSALLKVIGPPGLRTRMTVLAGALGDWVLEPGYPLEIVEIAAGGSLELSGEVVLEAWKTPHTDESLAYAVRQRGARLVYTGDTGPSDDLARWARGCDLLLAECSLPDEGAIAIHLSPTQAGALARAAGARRLALTHFYPAIEGTDPASVASRAFGGEVFAANDGDRFVIGVD
jgi:ribonuclease BN (tRNA processing enzyme)